MIETLITDNFAALDQFLSTYFHQDWQLENPDVCSVVNRYLREKSSTEVQQAINEISQLLALNLSDSQISQILLENFDCYYAPHLEGISGSVWLQGLQITFKQSLVPALSA